MRVVVREDGVERFFESTHATGPAPLSLATPAEKKTRANMSR